MYFIFIAWLLNLINSKISKLDKNFVLYNRRCNVIEARNQDKNEQNYKPATKLF